MPHQYSSTDGLSRAGVSSRMSWLVHWTLRLGSALCFVGHGVFGFIGKETWIQFFALVGFSREWGYWFMPIIGAVDILAGVLVLLRPTKVVLGYMVLWALWTAFLRPLTGHGMHEVWERAGNYGVPFALLFLSPGGWRSGPWFSGFSAIRLSAKDLWALVTCLQVITGTLLIGHGGFAVFYHKLELSVHWYSLGLFNSLAAAGQVAWLGGFFELILGAFILINPLRPLVLVALFWKVFTELLYPISGDSYFEFVERAGSYAAPLALFLALSALPSRRLEDFWPVQLLRKIPQGLNVKSERSFIYAALVLFLLAFQIGRDSTTGLPNSDVSPRIVNPVAISLIAGDDLVARLRGGGLIVYFRHFHTTVENVVDDSRQLEHGKLTLADFQDCRWQRPLVDYGIERAKAVGGAIRKLEVPVGKVLASPYCRCVDSAQLAAGRAPELDLGLLYRRKEYTRERMETRVDALLREVPANGTNTFIFAHRPPMDPVGHLAEGDAFVFEPALQGRYKLIGKIKAHEWVEALSQPSLLGREGERNYFPSHF